MRLSALTLIVPSYDEGISFYCGTMGFELTQDEDQGHKRWVRVTPSGGGTGFILAEPGDDTQRAAIGNQGAGRVWLFLETEDFARDHARLLAGGVTFEEAPTAKQFPTVAERGSELGRR